MADAEIGDLLSGHDALLLDVDGTLIRGNCALPAAAAVLGACRDRGVRLCLVTNNASRTPAEVAAHLGRVGIAVAPTEVLTAAEAAAELLQQRLGEVTGRPPRVVVCGGAGLTQAVTQAGMTALVDPPHEGPIDAVVNGLGPDLTWRHLAAAGYAVASGVPWIASNADLTYPTEHGLAPGNGTLIAAISAATGRQPDVAGKPSPVLFQIARERTGARCPLVVGDRLDTDIAAAVACGVDSLLVLSGVAQYPDLLRPDGPQPTYVGRDVSAVLDLPRPVRRASPGPQPVAWPHA